MNRVLAWLCLLAIGCGTRLPGEPLRSSLDLSGYREALCSGRPADVLAALSPVDPTSLSADDAILRARYLALAASQAGRTEALEDAIRDALARESRHTGVVPFDAALEYAELAFWHHGLPHRAYTETIRALESLHGLLDERGPEPALLSLAQCTGAPRRTKAQAIAYAHLRLGTMALNSFDCRSGERHFELGLQTLRAAGQYPDRVGETSYAGLLHNNLSELLAICDELPTTALAEKRTALECARAVGATKTEAIALAGYAFQAASLAASGSPLESDALVESVRALDLLEGVLLSSTPAPPGAADNVAKASALVCLLEAQLVRDGGARCTEADWLTTGVGLSNQADSAMSHFLLGAAFAEIGDWARARGHMLAMIAALEGGRSTLRGDARERSRAARVFDMRLERVMAWAAWYDDTEVAFAALERRRDLELDAASGEGEPRAPTLTGAGASALAALQTALGENSLAIAVDFVSHSQDVRGLAIRHNDIRWLSTHSLACIAVMARTSGAPESRGAISHQDAVACIRALLASAVTPDVHSVVLSLPSRVAAIPLTLLYSGSASASEFPAIAFTPSLTLYTSRSLQRGVRGHSHAFVVDSAHFDARQLVEAIRAPGAPGLDPAPTTDTGVLLAADLTSRVVWVLAHGHPQSSATTSAFFTLRPSGAHGAAVDVKHIERLRLDGSVVIALICGASSGESLAGYRIDSIAHAMLAAGATAVVASADELDASLSVRFAAALAARLETGAPIGAALRDALREAPPATERGVAAAGASPWEAMTLLGDPLAALPAR